jgi:L-fucose isomerase-like protein
VGTTFISIQSGAVNDVAGNPCNEIASSVAEPVGTYGSIEEAVLTQFKLNMDTSVLSLTFSGVVRAETFDPTGISLLDTTADSAASVTLSSGTTVVSASGFFIDVNVSRVDTDNLKRVRTLATGVQNTFLTMATTAFADISNRELLPVRAFNISSYTADTTAPTVTSFDLDIDGNGTVTLYFSETVDLTTFKPEEITIQASASTSLSVKLNGAVDFTPTDADTSVTVTLLHADLNAISTPTVLL